MVENVQENDESKRIRPLFLTIICSLAFINCAWILWNGLSNMGEMVEDHVKQNALITTIGGVFCIIGTALIWNMRQFGFGLYAAGTVFAIVGPIFIFDLMHVLNFETGYPGYLSLTFLLLFALNFKRLD